MKEEYLHLLWRLKRLPLHQMTITDGSALEVLDTGWHNPDAGPDFFNGKIKLNQVVWVGNIEFHVRSSDWYRHGHQHDDAYRNTILHVVYEHDQEVLINKLPIPTLVLKPYIDNDHYHNYQLLLQARSDIPCQNLIRSVDPFGVTAQTERAAIERLEFKALRFGQLVHALQGDLLQAIYRTYGACFGLRVNELPFQELCARLPLSFLWRVSASDAETLALGVAGMFQLADVVEGHHVAHWHYLKAKYQLSEMESFAWKFKGLRPVSFPPRMLIQFARLCQKQDLFRLKELHHQAAASLLNELFAGNHQLKTLIPVNVLAPIWWHLAQAHDLAVLQENAITCLQQLPPEHNRIIDQWKTLGIRPKSAFESQGLLELKNNYCSRKRCLSCKVGFQVMQKASVLEPVAGD